MVRLDRGGTWDSGWDRRRLGLCCRVWEDDVRDRDSVRRDGDEAIFLCEAACRGRLDDLVLEFGVLDS